MLAPDPLTLNKFVWNMMSWKQRQKAPLPPLFCMYCMHMHIKTARAYARANRVMYVNRCEYPDVYDAKALPHSYVSTKIFLPPSESMQFFRPNPDACIHAYESSALRPWEGHACQQDSETGVPPD